MRRLPAPQAPPSPPPMSVHIAYDDVTLSLIPPDAPIVVAYVDGLYANYDQAVARFGAEKVRGITVRGSHGSHIYWCDSENGDLTTAQAIDWVAYEVRTLKHTARGPYAAVSSMQAIIDGLTRAGISRGSYPVWTAHYAGAHICSPRTCAYPGFRDTADGTQFTDKALGRSLDESEITDRWLGRAPNPNAYPGTPIKYGDRGTVVEHIQQRLVSAHHWSIAVDGVFGGHTLGAIQVFQRNHGLTPDGVVGPQTWSKLFG